jgi:hypothetical protein
LALSTHNAVVDINRYAYAGNDPVNQSDANGHWMEGKDKSWDKDTEESRWNGLIAKSEVDSRNTWKNLGDDFRIHAEMMKDDVARLIKGGPLNAFADLSSAIPNPAAMEAPAIARGIGKAFSSVREALDRFGKVEGKLPNTLNKLEITTPYKRPNGATTAAQREFVQGSPCVKCGKQTANQIAGHKEALVKEYYETGKIDQGKMRSLNSVQSECATCSARQGAEMSRYSRYMRDLLGL